MITKPEALLLCLFFEYTPRPAHEFPSKQGFLSEEDTKVFLGKIESADVKQILDGLLLIAWEPSTNEQGSTTNFIKWGNEYRAICAGRDFSDKARTQLEIWRAICYG